MFENFSALVLPDPPPPPQKRRKLTLNTNVIFDIPVFFSYSINLNMMPYILLFLSKHTLKQFKLLYSQCHQITSCHDYHYAIIRLCEEDICTLGSHVQRLLLLPQRLVVEPRSLRWSESIAR